jgi:hypothetical protein
MTTKELSLAEATRQVFGSTPAESNAVLAASLNIVRELIRQQERDMIRACYFAKQQAAARGFNVAEQKQVCERVLRSIFFSE